MQKQNKTKKPLQTLTLKNMWEPDILNASRESEWRPLSPTDTCTPWFSSVTFHWKSFEFSNHKNLTFYKTKLWFHLWLSYEKQKRKRKKRIKIWNVEFYIKLENFTLWCLCWKPHSDFKSKDCQGWHQIKSLRQWGSLAPKRCSHIREEMQWRLQCEIG